MKKSSCRRPFAPAYLTLLTCAIAVLVTVTACGTSRNEPGAAKTDSLGAYRIDFVADKPTINRLNDQEAVITGNVLHNNRNQTPTGLTYTLTLNLRGGPVTGEFDFLLPPLAGRGPTTFANRVQPEIVAEHGHVGLAIRLLGLLGDRTAADNTPDLTFYRDPSSTALISLTVGERYELSNVRYTLTGIDMLLSAAPGEPSTAPVGPNNLACGGSFIDRVTILSSGGRNLYSPADPARIAIVGDVIRARFPDTDNSGHPDGEFDGCVSMPSTAGNVTVFHPATIGTTLQFEFGDAGKGVDGDADGYHDFDAPEQRIGLASGITFDLKELPPPTPDPNLTTISGLVFGDANGNGRRDNGESGLPNVTIELKMGDSLGLRAVMTTTTSRQGTYRLSGIQAGQPYYIEALVATPQLADQPLNPIRLIRSVTPTVAGPNVVDFAAWPYRLEAAEWQEAEAATLAAAGFLLPDLQPLTHFPIPDDLSTVMHDDIEHSYPGMAQWYLDTETEPGRVLMRFGTLALNRGTGPLHVLGGLADGDTRPAFQRIYTPSGAFIERLVGEFEHHAGHDHVHIAAFERYTLYDLESGAIVASGPKISFCLTDVLWSIEPALTAAAPVATVPMGWVCGESEQSINVGYSDYYGPTLPDQWIDITHVPDGRYRLQVTVNPEWKLLEEDLTNNTVSIEVTIENPLQ
jgi:hypothetical protein